MPFGPLGLALSQSGQIQQDPTLQQLEQIFNQAIADIPKPDTATLQSALEGVEAREAPPPGEMPAVAGPMGQLLSGFAGAMASQLGVRGAFAANQAELARQQRELERAEAREQAAQADFVQRKQQDRLKLQLEIGEAEQEYYQQIGDLKQLKATAKTNFLTQKALDQGQQEQITKRATIAAKAKVDVANIAAEASKFRARISSEIKENKVLTAAQKGKIKTTVDSMLLVAEQRISALRRREERGMKVPEEEWVEAEAALKQATSSAQGYYNRIITDLQAGTPIEKIDVTVEGEGDELDSILGLSPEK